MADPAFSITLSGDRDLVAAFKALRNDAGPKYVRGAVRKAANMLHDRIKAVTPVDTGKLKRNILVRTKETDKTMRGRVIVLTVGDTKNEKNSYYWRFVEMGHRVGTRATGYLRKFDRPRSNRPTGPANPAVGHFVQGRHFIENTYESWKNAAAQLVVDALEGAVDREIKKRNRTR
jgi:HK97 gp10 family phage protein